MAQRTIPTRSARLVRPPACGLDGTPARPVEARDQIDALGAALVNARRELIHASHLADELAEMGVHLKAVGAIALIDDATAEAQELSL